MADEEIVAADSGGLTRKGGRSSHSGARNRFSSFHLTSKVRSHHMFSSVFGII